jgi:hypothetical protein
MIILAKAIIPNCNVTPNLGTIILFHLEYQANQAQKDIICGSIATILSTSLSIM